MLLPADLISSLGPFPKPCSLKFSLVEMSLPSWSVWSQPSRDGSSTGLKSLRTRAVPTATGQTYSTHYASAVPVPEQTLLINQINLAYFRQPLNQSPLRENLISIQDSVCVSICVSLCVFMSVCVCVNWGLG